MFKAVIFDFDGVILNSEPLHHQASAKALVKVFGIDFEYQEYYQHYLGVSDRVLFPKVLASRGRDLSSEELQHLIQEKIKAYQTLIREHESLPMIAYLDCYLMDLQENNYKMAICSGGNLAEISLVLEKLKHGCLRSYFQVITSVEDVKKVKPDPEGYLLTAERLGVSPSECIVIEDTPHGVAAAKAAGMYVIGLLTTYTKDKLYLADRVVSDYRFLVGEGLVIT